MHACCTLNFVRYCSLLYYSYPAAQLGGGRMIMLKLWGKEAVDLNPVMPNRTALLPPILHAFTPTLFGGSNR
jgi:hypothetical protein